MGLDFIPFCSPEVSGFWVSGFLPYMRSLAEEVSDLDAEGQADSTPTKENMNFGVLIWALLCQEIYFEVYAGISLINESTTSVFRSRVPFWESLERGLQNFGVCKEHPQRRTTGCLLKPCFRDSQSGEGVDQGNEASAVDCGDFCQDL